LARTTIYLDDSLRARLEQLVPARKKNHFINQAVAEKLTALELQQLEQAMKEGYRATAEDRAVLNQEWDTLDVLDWPS
jgi:predicted transcriptional regulator